MRGNGRYRSAIVFIRVHVTRRRWLRRMRALCQRSCDAEMLRSLSHSSAQRNRPSGAAGRLRCDCACLLPEPGISGGQNTPQRLCGLGFRHCRRGLRQTRKRQSGTADLPRSRFEPGREPKTCRNGRPPRRLKRRKPKAAGSSPLMVWSASSPLSCTSGLIAPDQVLLQKQFGPRLRPD